MPGIAGAQAGGGVHWGQHGRSRYFRAARRGTADARGLPLHPTPDTVHLLATACIRPNISSLPPISSTPISNLLSDERCALRQRDQGTSKRLMGA